jgi:hypothetical protein
MKLGIFGVVAIAAAGLAACHGQTVSQNASHHGRYVGIGIYEPQAPWTKMVAAAAAKPTAAAQPIDDQAIVVVEDSDTGEVRACGDMTGYCIGMKPWAKPLGAAQIAPINLSEHVKPPSDAPPASSAPAAQ